MSGSSYKKIEGVRDELRSLYTGNNVGKRAVVYEQDSQKPKAMDLNLLTYCVPVFAVVSVIYLNEYTAFEL
jgi:hypothetical protein